MNITVTGTLSFISERQLVKASDRNDHTFLTLWIKTLETSYIAVTCWDDKIKKTEALELDEIVTLECRVESHRNKKKPDLFYHKVLLR